MKKMSVLVLSLLAMALTFSGCGKDKQPGPPPVELELSSQEAPLSWRGSLVCDIRIVSGNGGYKIVFPKQITIYSGPGPQTVDYYPGEILALHIEGGDHIIIERKLLTDDWVYGCFMVTDSKDQKRIIEVVNDLEFGYPSKSYFEKLESQYCNDPNYWQE